MQMRKTRKATKRKTALYNIEMPKRRTTAHASQKKRARKTLGTRKNIGKPSCPTPKKTYIVRTFLELLNVVKLYHWKTRSFPEHKNTDELYERLNEHIDKFVEVYLGKDGSRIETWNKKMEVVQYEKTKQIKDRMYQFREFLVHLSDCFDAKRDSDLLNIRDEILGDVNQFLYLLTFK
jgi:hypothetical protein